MISNDIWYDEDEITAEYDSLIINESFWEWYDQIDRV